MAVDQRRVGERPQMLHGWEFREGRRREEHVDMVWQALTGAPACTVKDQHEPFLAGQL
jgi:hypothetical protein